MMRMVIVCCYSLLLKAVVLAELDILIRCVFRHFSSVRVSDFQSLRDLESTVTVYGDVLVLNIIDMPKADCYFILCIDIISVFAS